MIVILVCEIEATASNNIRSSSEEATHDLGRRNY